MQLLRKKVVEFVRENGLFAPNDSVVVAFSGGADSMALLDILANLPDFPLKLVVAHLNHLLRGDESSGDELFARGVAEKYALPFEVSRIDVAAAAEEKGFSLEEAGRDVRRFFLAEIAGRYSAVAVALGHHRDDQAETVLMRLVRGAAGSGLTGMRPKVAGSPFVRPLLCIERSRIETYLRKGSLQWREDSSNTDTKFVRNRVRHELLPLLKSYNPLISDLLNQTALSLAADEELLESVVTLAFKRLVSSLPSGVHIDLGQLQKEPQALRKRIYRKALLVVKGDLRLMASSHLADIDSLIMAKKGNGKLSLPAGIVVRREYDSLIITAGFSEPVLEPWEISVDRCGLFHLPFCRTLSVERVSVLPPDWADADREKVFIDQAQFPFPWTVRSFSAGDWFNPLGMNGRKKLKDLFIDRKIPLAGRKRIPLFLCGDEIFWVGGVQLAEKARISATAGELLCLKLSGANALIRH